MRKNYGNTWWGKAWLNALNQIDYSNRLPRGKTYANKGAVKNITIDSNRIYAEVQGTRSRPYKVELTIPKFTASQKAKIIEFVTANPVFLSKLLNREIPPELYQASLEKGIFIFPNSWDDLRGQCSCPDWAVPCKHMAAVLYLVANEIDKNPFIVFELHAFDLFKGLEGIGYTESGQKEVPITFISALQQPVREERIPYEWDETKLQEIDFSTIPDLEEPLLTLLSENPVFYPSGNFKKILQKAYRLTSRNIVKDQRGLTEPSLTHRRERTDEIEVWLNDSGDFKYAQLFDSNEESIFKFRDFPSFDQWLSSIPMNQIEALAPELAAFKLIQRLAEKLIEQKAVIPQLLKVRKQYYKIRWLPANLNGIVQEVCQQVARLTPPQMLFYEVKEELVEPLEEDYFLALISLFLNAYIEQYANVDYRISSEPIVKMFFDGVPSQFLVFENQAYPGAIQLWLSRFFLTEKPFVPVLQIQDDENGFRVDLSVEDKRNALDVPIPLSQIFENDTYKTGRLDILRDLSMLTDFFPDLSRLIASRGEEVLTFNSNTFVPILLKVLPTIQLFGIKILLPKGLRKLLRPQLSMLLEGDEDGRIEANSFLSLESMLRFRWKIAIGDQLLSKEAFLEQVKNFSGIVKLFDNYVYVNERELKSIIEKLEQPPELDNMALFKVALTEEYDGANVQLDKQAQEIMQQLIKGDGVEVPDGLRATLRPYQLKGYEWLYKNARIGFGSIIADDMGLGKTLQVVAILLKLKEEGKLEEHKALVIVPTTLLTNWEKEIQKFAPDLQATIYHGPNRDLKILKHTDVLLTTYGIARSEVKKLQKVDWQVLVIDEAQQIKNPATGQTKAIKKIKAPIRIAMSGTPVENRLSEYWSIFDYSNKGYLGGLKKFKEEYARPIEADRDQHQLTQFKKITSPFILRRLKSDKSIIQDLPDKIEKDQFCQLSSEQAALYQSVIDTTMESIQEAEGINRRGLILKLITALKQVCNHPTHFLKKGKKDPQLSGKSMLLFDLLRQTLENGEKTLIFTQYKEMGNILVAMIKKEFGLEVPFLHGGVSRKNRDEMVEAFQHNRRIKIMILSLKAGGTGLNLTAASNVIHYDLWWNPAVEAQATDRAYRIGQNKNVLVHRFITKGTFEEKINKMLQDKKELADLTVNVGEKWIGDMSNSELKELVLLEN